MLNKLQLKMCEIEYNKIIADIEKGKKDFEKIKKRMDNLAKKGYPKACLFMRSLFLTFADKASNEQDKKTFTNAADNLLIMAANNGDVECQYAVAKMFEKGESFSQNDKEAFRYFLMAAKNGDRVAQTNVSRYYFLGIGVEQNATESMYWKIQAANNGESIAMNNLAAAYENGRGVPKDNELAIQWYKKALSNARHLLETFGDGREDYLESNELEAVRIANEGLIRMDIQILAEEYRRLKNDYMKEVTLKKIQKYADDGEWRAQFEIGLINANNSNYDEAMKWYKLAADKGSSGAMRNIGMMYYYAQGIECDYAKAYEWFMAAINCASNKHAMYLMGEMFEKGLYVTKDMNIAISWYKKAQRQGSEEAFKRLQMLGQI